MNKTKPTLAQQTYEKVCAIETILNRLLADSPRPYLVRSCRSVPSIWRRPAPRCLSRSSAWRTLRTTSPVSTRPTCCMASLACPS